MINCCIRLKMTRIISRMMVFIVKSVSIFFLMIKQQQHIFCGFKIYCFVLQLNWMVMIWFDIHMKIIFLMKKWKIKFIKYNLYLNQSFDQIPCTNYFRESLNDVSTKKNDKIYRKIIKKFFLLCLSFIDNSFYFEFIIDSGKQTFFWWYIHTQTTSS